MKQTNHLSKKEVRALVNAKITTGVCEIAGADKISATVQTAIDKASKLISAKLRKSLNAKFKSKPTAEPIQKSTPVAAKEITKTIKRKVVKKSSKSSKPANKNAGKINADRKPVKKVKVARRAAPKGKVVDQSQDGAPTAVPGTLTQSGNN